MDRCVLSEITLLMSL